jgi:hypothetical protein
MEAIKIMLFHGNPFLKKTVMEKCRPLENAFPLKFRCDGKEYFQVIHLSKVRVQAISALNDVKLLRHDSYWIG